MPLTINRRDWLKNSSLAALGLGLGIPAISRTIPSEQNHFDETKLINLGSNENPYGISPMAKEAIINTISVANRYQYQIPAINSFAKTLAAHYGLQESNILITPGSGEALALFARHFNNGNVITAFPSYTALPNTAKKIGTNVIEVPLNEKKVHDLESMLSAITKETSIINLVNPANPTGTILNADAIENFCREASKKTMVLVDEAYLDFVEGKENRSMFSLIATNPNIIVLRTFSKVYGLAGMRIGWLAAHPDTIAILEKNYFSHTINAVSNLSIAAAQAALKDNGHVSMTIKKNAEVRDFTFNTLTSAGFKAIPSTTNFIYFNTEIFNGDIGSALKNKNIFIRGSVPDKGKWARVSIGTMEEMKNFAEAIKSFS